MSEELKFIVDSYDQEWDGAWYATVICVRGEKPLYVYRIPADDPKPREPVEDKS